MIIKETIVQYFLNKDTQGALTTETVLTFNYMDNHFFTSIQFIEMIADIEEACSITFNDEHLKSPDFASVDGLIRLVEALYMEKQCVA